MRNRTLFAAAGLVAAAFASPAAAQGSMAGHDMTNSVTGSGKLPDGWMLRFDEAGSKMTQIDMKAAGTSLQFRSGPAAIYWNTRDAATNYFTVSGVFNQKKSMDHETYGLFIGGTNLPDATQNYLDFVIQPKGGTYQIKHRNGSAATEIVKEVADPAINKDAVGTGAATNALAIRTSKDSVHFYVNGKEVKTLAKTAIGGAATNGLVGLRINHNLDITVDGFSVKK